MIMIFIGKIGKEMNIQIVLFKIIGHIQNLKINLEEKMIDMIMLMMVIIEI